MNNLLRQLARNTGLLPDGLSAAILAGNTPQLEEIVMALLITTTDAYFVLDRHTSLNKRCIARMALAAAFLAAMAVLGQGEA